MSSSIFWAEEKKKKNFLKSSQEVLAAFVFLLVAEFLIFFFWRMACRILLSTMKMEVFPYENLMDCVHGLSELAALRTDTLKHAVFKLC